MINFDKKEILNFPYPIMIIDDFFEENFLNEILNEFPKNHEFMNFKKTMVNRRFLSNDNPDFYNYLSRNKSWSKFYKNINTYDFYEKILNLLLQKTDYKNNFYKLLFYENHYKKSKLKFNLSYFTKEITQIVPQIKFFNFFRKTLKKFLYINYTKNSGVYLRFDISSASNGYFRQPHTDSDGTIFAFLVYLEDQINIGGEGGDFLINDKNLNVIKSIKPKKNKALFFLSNKDSIHSVSKIANAKGWRKFIYGGFTSTDKNIWMI